MKPTFGNISIHVLKDCPLRLFTLLLCMLFSFYITGQDEPLQSPKSIPSDKELLSQCIQANDEKQYDELAELAIQLYDMAHKASDKPLILESIYYLTRANYNLRNYDITRQYTTEGIELASSLDNKERLAYLYNIMGIVERRSDEYNKAVENYQSALEINRQIGDSVSIARNLNNLSICYQELGDYYNAFNALNTSKEIRLVLKDTLGLANVYLNLGNGYFDISDFESAYENYFKASELYKSINNESRLISSLFNLGLVYQELDEFDKALNYYNDALLHAIESGDDEFMGIIYQNIGNLYGSKDDVTTSINYHRKAEEIYDTLQSWDQLAEVHLNMGLQYLHSNELDSAELYLYKSYDYVKNNASINDYINLIIELGHYHTLKGDYNKARGFLTQSVKLAESTDYLILASAANKYLYELYQKTKNHNKAIQHLERYHMFKDSIDRNEQERNIENHRLRLDINKQETQIALLNKENELKSLEVERAANQQKLFLVLLAFMALLAGGGLFLYQFTRKKNLAISKAKERSDNLLLNILPDETAEELKNFGKVKTKRYDLTTVLFTDFVNFTKSFDHQNSEDVVKSVDYYFSAFDKIVEAHNIEKIKTIGDAYMCVGGLPIADDDNALRVVKAAVEIMAFVQDCFENPKDGIIPFDIRIGINSGPVVAGVVGLHKFQYDIWGDSVNIAARMESAGEPGKINISETTYNLVKDHFKCSYRGEKDLKNKGLMKMYYIENPI